MHSNRAARRAARRTISDTVRFLRNAIDLHGFGVQGVSGSWDEPGFVHTVGLQRAGHPEFIVMGGLAPLHQHALIDALARRVLRGEVFAPGARVGDLIADHDVTFVEVIDTTSDLFGVAHRIQRDFRALQVVWPDPEGRFPWEEGYDLEPEHQCLLGVPPG